MTRQPRFRILLASILFLLGASPSSAGVDDEATAIIEQAVAEHGIPAVSAGIAVGGKILWTGAAGFADVERQIPASPDSVFRIASISKVLTAVATMSLVEDRKLDLDAPVQRYLSDYPESKKGPIRVVDLLAHTSGIGHYKGDENRSFEHYDSLREAVKVFENRKLAFKPGTRYRYTSYGFTLLGAVIEAAADQPFRSVMRDRVWKPADMRATDLETRPETMEGSAVLYRKDGGRVVRDVENDLSLIYPAGGMVSTAGDLLRFVIAFEDGKLVREPTMQRMLEAPVHQGKVLDENAGLGWNIWEDSRYGQVYHRVGGQSGSSALLVSYRDRGVAVVLLTNLARLDPIWTITNDLIGVGLRVEQDGAR